MSGNARAAEYARKALTALLLSAETVADEERLKIELKSFVVAIGSAFQTGNGWELIKELTDTIDAWGKCETS